MDRIRADIYSRLTIAVLLLFACAGCATTRTAGIPQFTISGITYSGLVPLCGQRAISFDYDPLTRVMSLTKNGRSMKLQAGSGSALVDGRMKRFASPVDLYKGMLCVPQELKEEIESLFPLAAVPQRLLISSRLKKIIIDPGHGGKDPGTTSAGGIREKDMVLDICRKLKEDLEAEGVQVVMTRSTDTFISLDERVEIANRSKPDLFVSIHANANKTHSLKGFEVYYISPEVSDTKRALVSVKSGDLDLDKSCYLSPSLNLKAILWDLTLGYNRRRSIDLSKKLCRAMSDNSAQTCVIGVKNANYAVLRGTVMPAVLVEVGYLSNPGEEALIASPSYRQKLADGIREGIRYYCEGVKQGQPDAGPDVLVKGGT
jgi:N-acetylmuramoyl-L-alanine amidase